MAKLLFPCLSEDFVGDVLRTVKVKQSDGESEWHYDLNVAEHSLLPKYLDKKIATAMKSVSSTQNVVGWQVNSGSNKVRAICVVRDPKGSIKGEVNNNAR